MSYPEVQNLFYGPAYDVVSDFSYPYKHHQRHSLPTLPSSVSDDNRDFGNPPTRTIIHMSSHSSLIPDRDHARQPSPSYSAHPADQQPPHTFFHQPPAHFEQHPQYNFMYAPNHLHGWANIDPLSAAPESSMSFGTMMPGMSFPEAPRLTPPPAPPVTATQRLTLAGSLDPATGIFYRTPEHPRLRTAQACEKCRTRKAKCSGEHPSCQRCLHRGLVCEYAKEGRVRGPNKVKSKASMSVDAQSATPPSSVAEDQDSKAEGSSPPASRRGSADKGPYSSKPSTPSSPTRRNPIAAGRRMSRTRPPHLRVETMSNQRDIPSVDLHTYSSSGEILHTEGMAMGGSSLIDEQNASFANPLLDPYADPSQTPRPNQGWMDMNRLPPESYPVVNEVYQPIATYPHPDGQGLQFHHTTDRRSIGSLSFSTGTTSSMSSPVTPLSATHTMHGNFSECPPEFQVPRLFPEGEHPAWQPGTQIHIPPPIPADTNEPSSLLEKPIWVTDAMSGQSGLREECLIYPQAYQDNESIRLENENFTPTHQPSDY